MFSLFRSNALRAQREEEARIAAEKERQRIAEVARQTRLKKRLKIMGIVLVALAVIGVPVGIYISTHTIVVEEGTVDLVFNDKGMIVETLEPGLHQIDPEETRQTYLNGNSYNIYSSRNNGAYSMSHSTDDHYRAPFPMRVNSSDGKYTLEIEFSGSITLDQAIAYVNEHISDNKELKEEVMGGRGSLQQIILGRIGSRYGMMGTQEVSDMTIVDAEDITSMAGYHACRNFMMSSPSLDLLVESIRTDYRERYGNDLDVFKAWLSAITFNDEVSPPTVIC